MKGPIIKAVIDIGTSRVRVVLAQFVDMPRALPPSEQPPREFIVYAVGMVQKTVMRNGVLINITTACDAIRSALLMAEKSSGLSINSATISISGNAIQSHNVMGKVDIDGREIEFNDIVSAVNQIRAQCEDKSTTLLHILQRQFVVDGFEHIDHPIGMKADELRLDAHAISTANGIKESLCRSVREAGVEVESVIYSGLASSYFATSKEERESGVLVIDLGAGTADMMLWHQDAPLLSMTLPVGGELVSSDLAILLKTPRQNAEDIKCRYGSVLYGVNIEAIKIPSTGHLPDRSVAPKEIIEIIRARYQDIFAVILDVLQKAGLQKMPPQGVVFTGGATQITGFAEFAAQHFKCPVRVFVPDTRQGMPDIFQHDASMTTVLGLLQLQQVSLADHVWAREVKNGIINRFKGFVKRYLLSGEE